MAELPMAKLVVPIPIACTYRPWKKQQWSVLEMVLKVSVFSLGLSRCSLSSLSHSEWCQLWTRGRGGHIETNVLGVEMGSRELLKPWSKSQVLSELPGQSTNMVHIVPASPFKDTLPHLRLISHSSVWDI